MSVPLWSAFIDPAWRAHRSPPEPSQKLPDEAEGQEQEPGEDVEPERRAAVPGDLPGRVAAFLVAPTVAEGLEEVDRLTPQLLVRLWCVVNVKAASLRAARLA